MKPRLEAARCALCGGTEADVFLSSWGESRVVRCRKDGLLYLDPRPAEADFQQTVAGHVPNMDMYTRRRRAALRREARALEERVAGGAWLDVGCSVGTLLEQLDPDRWERHGVELSVAAAQTARQRTGAEIFCGQLADAGYEDDSFDVITVLDSIYFFHDLGQALAEIRRCLKPGGILAVEIQGLSYWLVRDRGPLCLALSGRWTRPSSRLYYFSRATLTAVLEAAGFEILEWLPEQASVGGGRLLDGVNEVHFTAAKLAWRLSGGRVSIAGRELYMAVKAGGPHRPPVESSG